MVGTIDRVTRTIDRIILKSMKSWLDSVMARSLAYALAQKLYVEPATKEARKICRKAPNSIACERAKHKVKTYRALREFIK
jgi:hypothetical protein